MNDSALAKLDVAYVALAECKTAMEAKQIGDVAEAARVYMARTNASVDMVNRAAEIRTLAQRQMGEFLKTTPKATGDLKRGTVVVTTDRGDAPMTLAEMGISKDESSSAQRLADIPEAEFQERIALIKASGEMLTTAKILHEWSPKAKAAAAEAEAESEALWKLKSLWKKTANRDRKAFLIWIDQKPA